MYRWAVTLFNKVRTKSKKGKVFEAGIPDPFEQGPVFGFRRSTLVNTEQFNVAQDVVTPATSFSDALRAAKQDAASQDETTKAPADLDRLLRKEKIEDPTLIPALSKVSRDVGWNLSPLPDDVHYLTITSTMNNTFVVVSDKFGKTVIPPLSKGQLGYRRGGKRIVGPAAMATAQAAAEKALAKGIKHVVVRVSGFAPGRAGALSGLRTTGLNIVELQDVTPIPQNGPRPKKMRRRKRGVGIRLKMIRP